MQPVICRTPYSSLRNLKTIPCPAHGAQITRIFRIALNFLTQLAHVNVHRTGRDKLRLSPNGVKNLVAGENSAGMACKIVEQTKLCSRSRNGLAAHSQQHGSGINPDIACLHHRGRQRTLEAPQNRLNSSHHLAWAEGLADVIVGTQLQAQHPLSFTASRSQKNNRNYPQRCTLANLAAQI